MKNVLILKLISFDDVTRLPTVRYNVDKLISLMSRGLNYVEIDPYLAVHNTWLGTRYENKKKKISDLSTNFEIGRFRLGRFDVSFYNTVVLGNYQINTNLYDYHVPILTMLLNA